MIKEFSTCDMLQEMAKDRKAVFKRVGDSKFKVFCSECGVLLFELDDIRMELPILNYMFELWQRIE